MELPIKRQVPLNQYTTLYVGGVADYVAEVTTLEEVRAACLFALEQTNKSPLVLGGGSNVLIPDEGYQGMVILMNIKGREYKENSDGSYTLLLGAGELLDEVVAETCAKGLWGIENLSSIPGTIGATPVQNVGAYGVEVSSIIKNVHALHRVTLEEKIFSHDECNFSYRDSFFKTEEGKDWIITHVTYEVTKQFSPILDYADVSFLKENDEVTPLMVREAVACVRANKFPDWTVVGTAGSFFKNPIIKKEHYNELKQEYKDIVGYEQPNGMVKVSLGWILDKVCHLKGVCEDGVCLYEKQALVLVAERGVTTVAIKKFVETISKKVFEKTKIKIECEVLFI